MSMSPPSSTEFSGLDCLSTGTIVLSADDTVLYVNPAAETLANANCGPLGIVLISCLGLSVTSLGLGTEEQPV